ncbi:MAG: transcriptional regulator [Candidatus Helarchaeota archaeon]
MQFPCETIVREVLPAFKAFIVKELFHQYKLSQSEISTLLCITQASVSYYLRGERGTLGTELIQKYDKIKTLLLTLTRQVATKSAAPTIIVDKICEICATMQDEFGCKKVAEQ